MQPLFAIHPYVQPLVNKALEAYTVLEAMPRAALCARITGHLAYLTAFADDSEQMSDARDYASGMLKLAHLRDLAAHVRKSTRLPQSLKPAVEREVAQYQTTFKAELLQVRLALSRAVDRPTDDMARELVCVVLMDNAFREQGMPFIEDDAEVVAVVRPRKRTEVRLEDIPVIPDKDVARIFPEVPAVASQAVTASRALTSAPVTYPSWLDLADSGSEAERVARLRKGVADEGLNLRPTDLLPAPHPSVLDSLRAEMPGFGEVLDFVQGEIALCHLQGAPLKLSPILLVGPPSTGKTRFATRLADSLGLPVETFSFATESTVGRLAGTHPSIKGACEGNLFRLLASSAPKNAFYIVDEIEKTHEGSGALVSPQNALYGLLEQRTAREFRDDYVGVPVDASFINWIATANDLPKLSGALKSRFQVFRIERPEEDELLRIMLAAANETLLHRGLPGVDTVGITRDDIRILKDLTPRGAVPLIVSAIGLTEAGVHPSVQEALKNLTAVRRKGSSSGLGLVGTEGPDNLAYQRTRVGFTAALAACG